MTLSSTVRVGMKRLWKTRLGNCIYQSTTGIEVHQNLFYRWLTFGNDAIQTLINRRHPERPELRYLAYLTSAVRARPGDCCLLGLGGGGAAHMLKCILNDATLLAVEKHQEIIEIATKYFMIQSIPNLQICHADASVFVQQHTHQYQHLLIDLYEADAFPQQCNHPDFFSHCHQLLRPEGILAVNLVDIKKQYDTFQYIQQHFKQTLCLPISGVANMIVLASNGGRILSLLDLFKHQNYLRKVIWDAQWGCIAELGIYTHST
jgi:spermidine synthase